MALSPREALQNLHLVAEMHPCSGKERDALRESAEVIHSLIQKSETLQGPQAQPWVGPVAPAQV
jgi:hypothetical protein